MKKKYTLRILSSLLIVISILCLGLSFVKFYTKTNAYLGITSHYSIYNALEGHVTWFFIVYSLAIIYGITNLFKFFKFYMFKKKEVILIIFICIIVIVFLISVFCGYNNIKGYDY